MQRKKKNQELLMLLKFFFCFFFKKQKKRKQKIVQVAHLTIDDGAKMFWVYIVTLTHPLSFLRACVSLVECAGGLGRP